MTQEQLYKASVASGLSNMSWAELSGVTTSASNAAYNDNISESRAGLSGVGAYAPFTTDTETVKRSPGFQLLPTVGPMLILSFAEVV